MLVIFTIFRTWERSELEIFHQSISLQKRRLSYRLFTTPQVVEMETLSLLSKELILALQDQGYRYIFRNNGLTELMLEVQPENLFEGITYDEVQITVVYPDDERVYKKFALALKTNKSTIQLSSVIKDLHKIPTPTGLKFGRKRLNQPQWEAVRHITYTILMTLETNIDGEAWY